MFPNEVRTIHFLHTKARDETWAKQVRSSMFKTIIIHPFAQFTKKKLSDWIKNTEWIGCRSEQSHCHTAHHWMADLKKEVEKAKLLFTKQTPSWNIALCSDCKCENCVRPERRPFYEMEFGSYILQVAEVRVSADRYKYLPPQSEIQNSSVIHKP